MRADNQPRCGSHVQIPTCGCTLAKRQHCCKTARPACRYVHLREGQARAMTKPSVEDGRQKRSVRDLLRHPLVLAIAPAIIAAVAVIYVAGANTGHSLGIGPTPTVTVTVTQSATSTASSTSTPSSISTPSIGGGTSNAPGQEIFKKTGVQLTECYAVSFTAPSSLRPYQVPGCGGLTGDLAIDNIGNVLSTAQVAIYPGRTGFFQCQADTAYVPSGNAINAHNLQLTNSTLCVTTANRIAVCYVTYDTIFAAVPAPGLTMDVIVYALK
jgi:hypothetical protein